MIMILKQIPSYNSITEEMDIPLEIEIIAVLKAEKPNLICSIMVRH
jgi:hypothetical protein